jgi:undecaprenyl-diphosphatase
MLIFLLCIQIITESLPISSSGHVALAQAFLKQQGYDIIIPHHLLWLVHGITALLMLIIMMPYWLPLVRHPWRTRKQLLRMMAYGACSELLAAGIYVSLHGLVASMNLIPGFLITTAVLYSLQFCTRTSYHCSSFGVWVAAGIAQGIAVVPGCSRLAVTYAIARWLGYSGRHALLLSFTLALPLFISASLYGAYMTWYNSSILFHINLYEIIALSGATCVAYGALLFTSHLMSTDRAYYFAWYMILAPTLLIMVRFL